MISEQAWEAMQSGQEVPRGYHPREAWKILEKATIQTAIDVVRESCIERLAEPLRKARELKISLEARIRVLEEAHTAASHHEPGWEEKCRRILSPS
jgi:hypothetical protein